MTQLIKKNDDVDYKKKKNPIFGDIRGIFLSGR